MSTDAPLTIDTLPVDAATLPSDAALLKALIVQLVAALHDERRKLERLQTHLDLLVRRLYGRSSEKLDPRQGLLFESPPASEEPPVTAPPAEEAPAPPPARRRPRRPRRPDQLQRVDVVHDLTEAEKQVLAGGGELIPIGQEISEQYEWEPSCLYVVRHIQQKYARRPQLVESNDREKNVVTAPKPPQPLPGSQAGPGLLAQVLTAKYADHLPLHRQERIFGRHGLRFSRQTTCDWALSCAELLQPLDQRMRIEVLCSWVIHTDDTPGPIRDAHRKQKHLGRFWVYRGDAEHPLVWFDYTPSRSRDGPAEVLQGYQGYLQADAFGGYDGIYAGSQGQIVEVACWAHARRKFFEARGTDRLRAETALAFIGRLYDVERTAKDSCAREWAELPPRERYARIAALRQERARPVLEELLAWLTAEAPKLLPKHPLRQAMDYALGNWQALARYPEQGYLTIDNNPAENEIRRIALGRKNWLHCGSDRGGRAAAVHYSLIASCQRNGVDPWAYLRDVLTWLPVIQAAPSGTFPNDVLRDLLPDRWKPSR